MKRIYTLIMTAVICTVTILAVGLTAQAEGGITPTAKADRLVERLPETEYYMRLDSPSFITKEKDTLVVSNKREIYINKSGKERNIKEIDTSGWEISKIELIDDTLIVMLSQGIESKLKICDISTGSAFTDLTADMPSDITSISKYQSDNQELLAVFDKVGTQIYLYKASGNSLTSAGTHSIKTGKVSTDNAKIFDGSIYLYGYEGNDKRLFKVGKDSTDPISQPIDLDDYAFSGNDLYTTKGNTISLYTKNGGSYTQPNLTKSFNGNIASIYIQDNKLYATVDSDNRIIILDRELNEIGYYGDKGSEIDRLNTPKDVTFDLNDIYIADSGNKRLIVHSAQDNVRCEIATGDIIPVSVAVTDSSIYIVGDNSQLYMREKNNISDIPFTAIGNYTDIKAIERYNDYLAILHGDTIDIIDSAGMSFAKYNVSGARDIVIPYGTHRMYVFDSGDSIFKYDLESKKKMNTYSAPIAGKYGIDYFGNLFILSNGSITKYKLSEDGSVNQMKVSTDSLLRSDYQMTLNTYNGNMYMVDSNGHLLYKADGAQIEARSILHNSYSHPTDYNLLQIAKVSGNNVEVYASPDNHETSRLIKDGTQILIMTSVSDESLDDKYYYISSTDSSVKEYIKQSDVTGVCEHINMGNIAMSPLLNNTTVYEYPMDNAPPAYNLNTTDIVAATHRIAAEGVWDWYKILYNGNQIGYVKANTVAKISSVTPPDSVIFLTTRSKNVGEKIKMYAQPSLESDILFDDIDDGIAIQIYGQYDKNSTFTKVLYAEKVGYILTANLQPAGLTPNQIIAISVTGVCIVAFILIAVLLTVKKKHNQKNTVDKI